MSGLPSADVDSANRRRTRTMTALISCRRTRRREWSKRCARSAMLDCMRNVRATSDRRGGRRSSCSSDSSAPFKCHVRRVADTRTSPLPRINNVRSSLARFDRHWFRISLIKLDIKRGQRFVDVGSGLGIGAILVALITGADTYGVEIRRELHESARNKRASEARV